MTDITGGPEKAALQTNARMWRGPFRAATDGMRRVNRAPILIGVWR